MREWKAIRHLLDEELVTLDELSRAWQMPGDQILRMMENNKPLAKQYLHNLILRFRVNPLFLFQGEKPVVIPKEEEGENG